MKNKVDKSKQNLWRNPVDNKYVDFEPTYCGGKKKSTPSIIYRIAHNGLTEFDPSAKFTGNFVFAAR